MSPVVVSQSRLLFDSWVLIELGQVHFANSNANNFYLILKDRVLLVSMVARQNDGAGGMMKLETHRSLDNGVDASSSPCGPGGMQDVTMKSCDADIQPSVVSDISERLGFGITGPRCTDGQ
ncbi:hypothetical protein R1sor_005700 [Riccia sorocarpa]|uniref:Uncharacterized protein n=1 Tax=Riccia sorocarpa TaxID=122646 RepID=A0ABD3HNS0_9MARC